MNFIRPSSLPVVRSLIGLSVACLLTLAARAEDKPLHPELEKLRPLLGKTWRGEFKNSTPEHPIVDMARWERALNGQAVRVLHSINNGEYGGETLFFWNEEKKCVAYHYVTTAGFQTSGTLTFDGHKFTSVEKISGPATGITEVRATGEILPDGGLSVKAEQFKDGKWVPGHEAVYREDPKAEVVFK